MPKIHKPIKFPEDESVHNFIVEWWYFNGNVEDKNGNAYAFMNCLFRVNVKKVKIPFLSNIPLKTSYFSHSFVTDLKRKKIYSKITPFSIISEDSFSKPRLFINYMNPRIGTNYVNCVIEKTGDATYRLKNEDIDLNLISTKKPLLEGGAGFLDLHPKTTYYYSLTNLKTDGRIKIGGKWMDVSGKSWMDHQWANASRSKIRWDWFSVQLNNDVEMVCCMFEDGKNKTYFADISYPDGHQEHHEEAELVPQGDYWKSPKSKAAYPVWWKIKMPGKNTELNLRAKARKQEMLFGSINYWEGPLAIEGLFEGKRVHGDGFMELVGYPSQYGSMKYIKDETIETLQGLIPEKRKRF